MAIKTHSILIVDDEKEVLDSLSLILSRVTAFKLKITSQIDSTKALELINKNNYSLIISDYKMSNINGIELLETAMQKTPITRRILITGYTDTDISKDAIKKEIIHSFLEKPWENDILIEVVTNQLNNIP
jgi:two-component system, repressor protein LuxO